MSDENMNSNQNEDTAALFVSAQKRKKAEEEERRRAEAEKAKRDAAEEEVRKMEQEVEERKRKAEEERRALEEAEREKEKQAGLTEGIKEGIKESAAKATQAAKAVQSGVAAKKEGNNKLPLIIGIAVAVVAVIIIAVFALKGGGGSKNVNLAEAEFNNEYLPNASGFDIRFKYPDGVFADVLEASDTDGVLLTFSPLNKKGVNVRVDISEIIAGNDLKLTVGKLGFAPTDKYLINIQQNAASLLEQCLGKVDISNEATSDLTSTSPGPLEYSCDFTSEEYGTGSLYSWMEPNTKGEYKLMSVVCHQVGGDSKAIADTCKLFAEKNKTDPLMVPGGSPMDANAALDSMLNINELHMGIPVPSGRFEQHPDLNENEGHVMYSDKNGVSIWVDYTESTMDIEDLINFRDANFESIKNTAIEGGATKILNRTTEMVTSREFVGERRYDGDEFLFAYHADFNDVIGGVPYSERYYYEYWIDVKTEKPYFFCVVALTPTSSKGAYQNLFDNLLSNMKDI